jgi:hypothetical protein
MNPDQLKTLPKDQIDASAKNLTSADIKFLVETLSEKDDKIRYSSFLLLQAYSKEQSSVYQYWDVLAKKLDSDNSYQRSLGIMLIAENIRWDKEGKFGAVFEKYMVCCSDEKFITARQTIQGLETIMETTDKYSAEIKKALATLDFKQYKENQQKLLKKDVANAIKTEAKHGI